MNVLIYGGSFNPIHYAHINNIRLGIEHLNIDKVILVCDKYIHFKDNEYVLDYDKRIEMIKMVLKEYYLDDIVEVSLMMKDDVNKRYSYDVIREIRNEYVNDDLFFLIGSDQAKNLDKWYNIDELKKLVRIVITKRSYDVFDKEYIQINNEILDYSSTNIRKTYASSGIAIIDDYIREKGFYLECVLEKYLSKKRIEHSKNVAMLARRIAKRYGINEDKAYVAGMLHDIAKEQDLKKQYDLVKNDECFELNDMTIHAYSAVHIISDELAIKDQTILNAIKYHTTAYYIMSDLDKLIYVCDMLSKERYFDGIEKLRELLIYDLDTCYLNCVKVSLTYLKEKKIVFSNELIKLEEMIEKELANGK